MSDTMANHDAVFGGDNPAESDWKKKYEQLEKDYASARVEQGRVKKLDEEKKALEKELADLRSRNTQDGLLSSLSEDERESIAPEVLNATAKLMAQQREEFERRLNEMRAEISATSEKGREASKEDFVRKIDATFPGFISAVSDGGKNAEAWMKFKRSIGRYIDQAYSDLDFEGVSYFIRRFYNEIGSEVPNGERDYSSVPDPKSVEGGIGGFGGSGKIYSRDEIMALYDRIEECRRMENFKEAARIESEIDKAMSEGRIK